jgi:mono/diheme cytochrome c family protein
MKSFVRNSSGPMPPFREKILSDAALDDIHAYLASIPKTQDWKTIKLLQD